MLRPALLAASFWLSACAAEAEPTVQADAASPNAPPAAALELTGRVVDAANILSADFEANLTARLAKLEEQTQVQFVVATTPDLKGRDIAFYSLDLANAWGIGSEDRDDGLMLLVAPNERSVRIEVGYGLEASVKDEEAAAIIERDIIPAFRDGDYEAGVQNGVDSLVREVTPYELKEAA